MRPEKEESEGSVRDVDETSDKDKAGLKLRRKKGLSIFGPSDQAFPQRK